VSVDLITAWRIANLHLDADISGTVMVTWLSALRKPTWGATLAFCLCQLGSVPVLGQVALSASGLPLPRYVSLKSDHVNLRKGPGTDYPISWVYTRVGLPVEIIKEFENWRQVRDSDGTEGWVLQNLLSGRRTALVAPWDARKANTSNTNSDKSMVELYSGATTSSSVLALIEPGALVNILSCDRSFCWVSISDQRGYVAQGKLWGVYKDEIIR
jgi:SH3-like domain-containing protein